VGQKLPNHFGLFDMHGNVTEVCEDVFNPTFYSDPEATDPDPIQACLGMSCGTERPARRGGGWKSSADDSRSFSRQDVKRNDTFDDTGFRVVFCPQGCPTSIPPPP
jgi:formylglycine-generating enzyme required for sulfatase activity